MFFSISYFVDTKTAESLNVNFLLPPQSDEASSRTLSANSSRKSSNASNIDIDEDMDRYFSDQPQLNDSRPGIGQVTPKNDYKGTLKEFYLFNS
jgi:hypothetical protein